MIAAARRCRSEHADLSCGFVCDLLGKRVVECVFDLVSDRDLVDQFGFDQRTQVRTVQQSLQKLGTEPCADNRCGVECALRGRRQPVDAAPVRSCNVGGAWTSPTSRGRA